MSLGSNATLTVTRSRVGVPVFQCGKLVQLYGFPAVFLVGSSKVMVRRGKKQRVDGVVVELDHPRQLRAFYGFSELAQQHGRDSVVACASESEWLLTMFRPEWFHDGDQLRIPLCIVALRKLALYYPQFLCPDPPPVLR